MKQHIEEEKTLWHTAFREHLSANDEEDARTLRGMGHARDLNILNDLDACTVIMRTTYALLGFYLYSKEHHRALLGATTTRFF